MAFQRCAVRFPIASLDPIALMDFLKHDIFLVGMPACGKSTLGSALATRLQRPFVDLDHYVEQQSGLTINEIFSQRGEEAFRQLESQWLRLLPEGDVPLVVATGGGTPCFGDNMNYINDRGISIYLEVSEEELGARLRSSTEERPLVKGLTPAELKEYLSRLLAKRAPYYHKAALILSGKDASVDFAVQRLQSL